MNTQYLKSLEGTIRSQLKSIGYFKIEIRTEQERIFNVVADGPFRNIFLKVIVYLVSEPIKKLSREEIANILHNADVIKKEPWTAIMRVNENGELVESIDWTNLSKLDKRKSFKSFAGSLSDEEANELERNIE